MLMHADKKRARGGGRERNKGSRASKAALTSSERERVSLAAQGQTSVPLWCFVGGVGGVDNSTSGERPLSHLLAHPYHPPIPHVSTPTPSYYILPAQHCRRPSRLPSHHVTPHASNAPVSHTLGWGLRLRSFHISLGVTYAVKDPAEGERHSPPPSHTAEWMRRCSPTHTNTNRVWKRESCRQKHGHTSWLWIIILIKPKGEKKKKSCCSGFSEILSLIRSQHLVLYVKRNFHSCIKINSPVHHVRLRLAKRFHKRQARWTQMSSPEETFQAEECPHDTYREGHLSR